MRKFFMFIVVCGRVEATDIRFPAPLISENEGKHVSLYHSYLKKPQKGDPGDIFMPKNNDELEGLYEYYKTGKPVSKYLSPLKSLWNSVLMDIKLEIEARCKDCLKSPVDEFISAFGSFVSISEAFHDQSFMEPLYGKFGLTNTLQMAALNLESFVREHPEMTWSKMHAPYIVNEINKILAKSQHFKDWDFNEYFATFCLSDAYKESPEYKALYATVENIFREGIPLLPK